MKHCSKCKELKPFVDFYSDKRTSSGLKSQCKKCHIEGSIRTRDYENTLRLNREYMARARIADPKKINAREREYQSTKPKNEKYRSRLLLNSAVRSGRIRRPEKCERCDVECNPHGHHTDYAKPLDVIWLCTLCHGAEHRKHLKTEVRGG